MFELKLTQNALRDLRALRKFEQSLILDSIEEQLKTKPAFENRNKKRLRLNNLSSWELRIQKYRVFYDVDPKEKQVVINAVGWKKHNKLYIQNQEYCL
ncbi:MAG: type II toxin-antitoxin system RelE/ParE family toxin [Candidatus Thiosymbion ectosymbiont of Robbea hypermnestra]|nr:type II toxin-antitoxin system RelE/ParE family toxin [Candidatus Thiosymbion ectosymbiont of Robbea hypermnestra]